MTRLETLAPDLADKLRRASPVKQRAASVAASEFAITHAKVEHPLVEKALEKVRAGGVLTPKDKAEIDALVARLDEEYFELQEAAEEGRASTEDYLRVFGQARAVAALSFAGNEDAFAEVGRVMADAIADVHAAVDAGPVIGRRDRSLDRLEGHVGGKRWSGAAQQQSSNPEASRQSAHCPECP